MSSSRINGLLIENHREIANYSETHWHGFCLFIPFIENKKTAEWNQLWVWTHLQIKFGNITFHKYLYLSKIHDMKTWVLSLLSWVCFKHSYHKFMLSWIHHDQAPFFCSVALWLQVIKAHNLLLLLLFFTILQLVVAHSVDLLWQ